MVVLIIGMLAAAVAWNFAGQGDKAHVLRPRAISTLKQMLVNYQLEAQYPASLQALGARVRRQDLQGRLEARRLPLLHPRPMVAHSRLISSGPDGQSGTPDDISVWTMDDAAPAN